MGRKVLNGTALGIECRKIARIVNIDIGSTESVR